MILTGHQPNYLPYPGFFDKIMRSDLFLIVDTVQFVKRGPFGWIHRNRIHDPGPEGWSWLTVPVITHDRYHQSILETRIDNRLPWRRKHWRTIEGRYRDSPGLREYGPALAGIYGRPWGSLAELNEALIREILGFLDIRTPMVRLSELGARGRSTELIVNFCRDLGATEYLSGMHGRDYLDANAFERAGIGLTFQEFKCPEYVQPGGGLFVPNLSIIDLLLCCGTRSREVLESCAEAVAR
jgi:hypothetical protein